MSRFLIGQVCNALGVRAHVLRYWERHVELLSPAKDLSGRRMYTLRDVQLLFRLKYLVYTRGMSVEGASRKLVEEVQGGGQNRKAALDSLRGDLFRVSLGAQRLGERLEAATSGGRTTARTAGTAATSGGTRAGTGETRRPALGEGVAAVLRQMVEEALRRSQAAPEESPGHDAGAGGGILRAARQTTTETGAGAGPVAGTAAETAPAPPGPDGAAGGSAPPGGSEGFPAARDLLQRAPLLVVTPAPALGHTVEQYPGLLPLLGRGGETVLDRIGGQLSALAREFGHEPLWIIGGSEPVVAAVRAHVARRGFYGLSPGRIRVYAEPRLPHLSAEGHVLTLILPVTNALPRVPDLEFISRHLDSGAGVSVKAARVPGADGASGSAQPTGEALLSTGMHTAVPRDIPVEVRRFGGEDDILETEAMRGRFEMEQLLEAADIGLIFEIDARTEVASL
ncbi:MAG: MerR family transcriptional regulator, partial [Spirochaetia bacterium]